METPLWNFESTLHVYEPSEDSFLLMDALETDLLYIKDKQPSIVLEIGSGSGIIICALSKALRGCAYFLAVDISNKACLMTQDTSTINLAQVDIIQGDLTSCLKSSGLVDLVVFNPPYVVTSDDEICGTLQRAWAGGAKGRVVIDRLLDQLDSLLSPNGLFYLVVIKENVPEEILDLMKIKGFDGKRVAFKKIRGEQLEVLRFSRNKKCQMETHS